MALGKGEKVSWASLPRKDQLFILCLMRFAEPVVGASIGTFIYYQLQFLDPSLSSSQIIRQAAFLNTAFQFSRCFSILFLGKIADSPWGGRKFVLLMGSGGSLISCVAFGFIKSFPQALGLRILEGLFNGNMATIRAMVGELVRDKSLQARAYVLLPITFNLAIMVSPLMAGQLADLAGRYPERFGHVEFLKLYPYAPPALLNGSILLIALCAVFFFLEETLEPIQGRYDVGLAISAKIRALVFGASGSGSGPGIKYSRIGQGSQAHDENSEMAPMMSSDNHGPGTSALKDQNVKKTREILPFRRIWTRPLCFVMLAYMMTESHTTAYNTLWPSFLSTPVALAEAQRRWRLPFLFSGGAGFSTDEIGYTLAMLGIVGFPAQLLAYPRVQQRLGTVRVWRMFLFGFPVVYLVIPYIAVLPSSSPPPAGKSGWPVWALVTLVQFSTMLCATFVMPSQILLVNSASPHPSALGRTHSIAILLTSICRAATSALSGLLYSYGSSHNLAGLAWWCATVIALGGCCVSFLCEEGNGHQIKLEGDAES